MAETYWKEEKKIQHTKIEWALNPDGTQGYTWNPITGCLKGCEYCYARKLANNSFFGIKEKYLANDEIATTLTGLDLVELHKANCNPFYPRWWADRYKKLNNYLGVGKGIFTCDMSDLFGIGIPEKWTRDVLSAISWSRRNRFYLLTKQPQNLIKFSPFPDNVWLGVSVTKKEELYPAIWGLTGDVHCSKRFLSFEPLLENVLDQVLPAEWDEAIDWVIVGAQSPRNDKTFPEWKWVKRIIACCDLANIPVFLKNNLGLPRLSCEGGMPFYKKHPTGTMELRQELPE